MGRLAPPLLSGALLAAATPPALSPVLPFIALVPLAVHLARLPSDRADARAFEAGALAALIQHGWGLRWLGGTLTAVAGPATGWAATVAVLVTLSGFGGVAAWCARRLLIGWRAAPARSAGRLAAGLALAWTALEWTLAHLPFGLAFPWAPLGLGLAAWPHALGIAELVGVTGVTAWLALVNGLIAAALLGATGAAPARRRAPLMALGTAALVALLPIGWGWWRARTLEPVPMVRVLALTLDVPPDGSPQARAEATVAAAERVLSARTGQTDLIVLPEMALPMDVDSAGARALVARLRRGGERLDAPVLIGARTSRGGRAFNSAVLLSGPAFRAGKRRLVPGAERGSALVPAWLAPASSGYAPGRGWPVLEARPLRAGVLICYEVAFADDARRLVRAGAGTLIALSNDAWFGGSESARAAGVAQQLAHLTLRAIETRSGAVRSANGGPAAEVDAAGRVRVATPPGALAALVPATARSTLFVRTGDWVGPAALLGLLLVLALLRRAAGTGLADP